VPAVTDGRILGHEGVGTITEIGSAVSTLAVGDRVIICCISACGACSYCHQSLYAHCLAEEGASGIGWIFGHLINGTQAELVRVPFADNLGWMSRLRLLGSLQRSMAAPRSSAQEEW
jgi:alcohol dehydrogenase